MSTITQIPPLTLESYQADYARSIAEPGPFWAEQAEKFLTWDKKWNQIARSDFSTGDIRWFEGAKLNLTTNCIDRHLAEHADRPALIFEGDDPANSEVLTYQMLYEKVCQMANVLKALGVKKGDRVCLYMPMIPMTAVAMLACARIGAVHSVVFGGFSAKALYERIQDLNCSLVITADEGTRGGKNIPLKAQVSEALKSPSNVTQVLVLKCTGAKVPFEPLRDRWYHDVVTNQKNTCPAEPMNAEDPLFILYTSGSTDKPKGVLHTQAGYLLYAAMTFRYAFDYRDGEVFWCTADAGWITGHTYSLYAPLANAATTLWFEGVPTHPTPSRFWEVIDKHQVNIFYTAPTAIRSLMAFGDAPVQKTSRQSLRILGTVGEPINPEAWRWYNDVVGEQRCFIVDTWWQTETGGIMISPLPNVASQKPGSACLPFFGVQPALLSDEGVLLEGEATGNLVIKESWPGQMRGLYQHEERFIETYFKPFPGYFSTGDGASQDADGDWTITGRVDDTINIAGHRLGTAEIESIFVAHPKIVEAAVVGVPDKIKGQTLYAFVSCINDCSPDQKLKEALLKDIVHHIGKFAKFCTIQWCSELPKTRSGKIMRRLLRKIATQTYDDIGDTSTLAEPNVLKTLIKDREKLFETEMV